MTSEEIRNLQIDVPNFL
ncbi:Protein of unknown function [Bacillus cereus]|nr:Protein of unknown function [Bacillus cereus]